jgi:hypothetical protein
MGKLAKQLSGVNVGLAKAVKGKKSVAPKKGASKKSYK